MNDHRRLEARVIGRVQGVGFRWFVKREASRLQLTGWTQNHADGSVRVVAEGATAGLDELQRALETGPPGAEVDRVEAVRSTATGSFERFDIRSGSHRGD